MNVLGAIVECIECARALSIQERYGRVECCGVVYEIQGMDQSARPYHLGSTLHTLTIRMDVWRKDSEEGERGDG